MPRDSSAVRVPVGPDQLLVEIRSKQQGLLREVGKEAQSWEFDMSAPDVATEGLVRIHLGVPFSLRVDMENKKPVTPGCMAWILPPQTDYPELAWQIVKCIERLCPDCGNPHGPYWHIELTGPEPSYRVPGDSLLGNGLWFEHEAKLLPIKGEDQELQCTSQRKISKSNGTPVPEKADSIATSTRTAVA